MNKLSHYMRDHYIVLILRRDIPYILKKMILWEKDKNNMKIKNVIREDIQYIIILN